MSEYPKKLYAVIDGEEFEATAENDAEEWNLSRSGYLPKAVGVPEEIDALRDRYLLESGEEADLRWSVKTLNEKLAALVE
jgi:hypothetical protein